MTLQKSQTSPARAVSKGRKPEPFIPRAWAFLGMLALLLGGFFPFIWTVLTSLKTETELQVKPVQYLPEVFRLENYNQVFIAQPFGRFFLNSILTAGLSTVVCVIIAALAAYALSRLKIRARGPLLAIVVIFSMFPAIALAVPLFKIMRELGILNTYPALILPYVALNLPISILTLVAFFSSIPADLESAAQVDGCSKVGALWRIIMPLAVPGVVTAGLITFVNSWNEYLLALLLTSNASMRTLSVGVTLYQGEFSFPWALMSAAIVVALIPIVVLIVVFQRRLVSGLTAGSVKG